MLLIALFQRQERPARLARRVRARGSAIVAIAAPPTPFPFKTALEKFRWFSVFPTRLKKVRIFFLFSSAASSPLRQSRTITGHPKGGLNTVSPIFARKEF